MFYMPTPASDESTECKATSLNDYETDWQRLNENEIHFIRTYSLSGNLRLSRVRSIYWRMLLNMFPDSSSDLIVSVRSQREQYNDIRTNFTIDPHTSSCIPDDNPLSLDQNSIWNKYFCDQELKRFIRQDVTRTSSDRKLFQLPNIHERLVDILFYYARQNPDICYRQGMHELLAPIVSILHADCDNFAKVSLNAMIDSTLTEVLDSDYLDHDAYFLFSSLMKHMKKFYEIEGLPNSNGYFPPQSSFNESNQDNLYENAINTHLTELRDELKKYDPTLHDHLRTLDINYSVFGIRWLRLLFGREFSFENLLILWDAIFAVDSDFALVKYVSLALLIIQRRELLMSDEVQCLKYLMKCPCSVNVTLVIHYALYLSDPKSYKEPTLPVRCNNGCSAVNYDLEFMPPVPTTHSSIPRNNSMETKVFKNKKRIDRKISSYDDPFDVIDEYSPKSFAMLVSELKHMRFVMSLCKIKLMQYHSILASTVPDDDVVTVRALEGINEICQFLDVDHFSLKSSKATRGPPHVEPAIEAAEVVVAQPGTLTKSYSNPTLDVVASFLPPPNTDLDMILFNYSENEPEDPSKFPRKNPVQRNL